MGTIETKQLGQARPADTNFASLYSPATGVEARIDAIIICNTSDAPAKFSICHDENGSTYDESTAIWWEEELAANSKTTISPRVTMRDASGNLAVQSSVASALTFSAYGMETS